MICSRFYFRVITNYSRSVSTSAYWNQQQEKTFAEQEKIDQTSREQRMKEIQDVRAKTRHIGLMGGFFAVLFGTQAYFLIKRQRDYTKMNEKLPPITYEDFKNQYLKNGIVEAVVFYPNFGVFDVYLNNLTEEEKTYKKQWKFLSTFSTGPERFAPVPDVRVRFNGKIEDLEKGIIKVQSEMDKSSLIKIESDCYPSFRELAFIIGSSILTVACLAVATS